MDEKKDSFEVFKNYPNEQNVNPAILEDAKKLAQELHGAKPQEKRKKTVIFSTVFASVMTCILFVAIFLPIYFSNGSGETEKKYFSSDSIYSKDIENIESAILENNLNVKYYKIENAMEHSTASYYKDDNKIAFLTQQLIVMGKVNFDNITLGIVPTDNEFEEFDKFKNFDKSAIIQEIAIDYKNEPLGARTIITAKFKYKNINYYLAITTESMTGKLDSYVKILLT